jgi:amidohydrolase
MAPHDSREIDLLKRRACDAVDDIADRLVAASRSIHANPEVMFEEHHAHAVLTDLLASCGIEVERGAHGLETAFRADAGEGSGPVVAICCEYDALPDIGHACGHNVIGAAGVGAGLAAALLAAEVGGRVRILGTPAEEGGNGKGLMADDGAFDGVAAALMVHPGDRDLRYMTTLAATRVEVTYHGKAAHAAASPWHGVNALDAAVMGYVNVAAMRQHLAPDQRIHGTFVEVPEKSNIIPERVVARWAARGRSVTSALDAFDRLIACLRAGAEAARCEIELEVSETGSQVLDCDPLVDRYAINAARLGRSVDDPAEVGHMYGSTDMGRVSRKVPSLHAVIKVAPTGIGIHERAFTAAAGSPDGDRAVIDGAKAMAMTVIDVWTDESLLPAAREHFEAACLADPLPAEP